MGVTGNLDPVEFSGQGNFLGEGSMPPMAQLGCERPRDGREHETGAGVARRRDAQRAEGELRLERKGGSKLCKPNQAKCGLFN